MISTNIVQTGFQMSGAENVSLSTGNTGNVNAGGTDFGSYMNNSESTQNSAQMVEKPNAVDGNVQTVSSVSEKVNALFTANNQNVSGDVPDEDIVISASVLVTVDMAAVQLIQQVMEVIQSATGCSDEELINAMDNIGAQPSDLLSLETIKNIVLELNGLSSPQELLTSQEAYNQFADVIGQVQPLTEDFMAEYGFTPEQFEDMPEIVKQFLPQEIEMPDMTQEGNTSDVAKLQQDKMPESNISDKVQQDKMPIAETKSNIEYIENVPDEEVVVKHEKTENTEIIENSVNVPKQDAQPVSKEITEEVIVESDDYKNQQKDTVNPQKEYVVNDKTADTAENDITLQKTQSEPEMNQNSNNSGEKQQDAGIKQNDAGKEVEVHTSDKKNVNIMDFTEISNNLFEHIKESVSEVHTTEASQVSFATRIFNQVMEGIKVLSGEDMSSMEMQLQPENLGKLNIQVISKNGIITAQIITQNEAVKQAIESQMFVLKDNMNNHDIAIEDVEVTVSSHAFEQGMDNGSHENSENKQKKRKFVSEDDLQSINAADIKAIKEEILEEAMKEQNGSTVSYTA